MSLFAVLKDKRDLSKFRMDLNLKDVRVSRWTQSTGPIRVDSIVHVYRKLSQEPELEQSRNASLAYMKRKYELTEPLALVKPLLDDVVSCTRVEPKLSAEEAEKISTEIINSFGKNRDMRELLEGAKFFAGASALAGAPDERRARRKISFT